MAKNLVIVESPAKAKTIEKFLGKGFQVESSYGHIADLPSKELGIDVEGDFSPNEIELALNNSFTPVSLGDNRLRTETAGIVACTIMKFQSKN